MKKKYLIVNPIFVIYVLGFTILSILLSCILILLVIVVVLVTFESKNLANRERYFDGIANQKLFLIYSNGHVLTMKLKKDLSFKAIRKPKFEYDICSYFGFYEYPFLNVYAGSIRNVSNINSNSKDLKIIGKTLPDIPYHFEVDSTYAMTRDYFWVIGANYFLE